jgi:predicted porin
MKNRMIYIISLLLSILFFCSTGILYPQNTDQNDSSRSRSNFFKPEVNPWARIKLMIIETNNNIGITDAGSRFGVKVKQNVNNDIILFGGIELSMFLTSNGGFRLSPENSSTTGFLNVLNVNNNSVFGLRKGYLGADFKKFGVVSIGKQYGAYYEVAGVTDISENNSGYASFVYSPDGSDGGSSGTGRASNSFLYKNKFGNLNLALSGQFKLSEKKFSRVVNSTSGSLIYNFPFNINAGIAYNEVFLDPDVGDRIRGLNADPVYSSAGINYTTDNLFIGFNYAYEENGDIAKVGDSTVVYSGYGIELSAMWKPYKNWSILGGVNYKQPRNVDELVNKSFNRLVYFYGLQFEPFDNLLFFLEGAIDRSVTETGQSIPDNISIGIKFNF